MPGTKRRWDHSPSAWHSNISCNILCNNNNNTYDENYYRKSLHLSALDPNTAHLDLICRHTEIQEAVGETMYNSSGGPVLIWKEFS